MARRAFAKLHCVLEKAASDFNRRQNVPTVVSTEVDESKQVHRDATKDHKCIVAAVVLQVEEVSSRVVNDTVDPLKREEQAIENTHDGPERDSLRLSVKRHILNTPY